MKIKRITDHWYRANVLGIEGYFYCKKHKKIHTCFTAKQYLERICPS